VPNTTPGFKFVPDVIPKTKDEDWWFPKFDGEVDFRPFPLFPRRNIERSVTTSDRAEQEAQLKIEHFWAGTLKRAVIEGDIEHGSMMAGQSVGMVTHEQPTQDVINELILQATSALESRTMPKAAALC